MAALMAVLWAVPTAFAGEIAVSVADKHKQPLDNAVVTLRPVSTGPNDAPPSALPDSATIGQKNLTFVPLVTLVRKGGQVSFTNNDNTGHHVYSFSAIKQFQFVLKTGEQSAPVTFDESGIAAIGCNIHDQMLAYVYVSDAPFGAVTGKDGRADFSNIPDGPYTVEVWHPEFRPGEKPAVKTVTVGVDPVSASFALSVSKPAPMDMHKMPY